MLRDEYADSKYSSILKLKDINSFTLICFSHLRWDFVFQRPQHLMLRFAKRSQVLFWEEAEFQADLKAPFLNVRAVSQDINIITPQLPSGLSPEEEILILEDLLNSYIDDHDKPIVRWYYTPLMLSFSRQVSAVCTVYDCMDELANFKFASSSIAVLEKQLFEIADLVFTGGYSLYEAKRSQHDAVYAFPSSVDQSHFATALKNLSQPADQASLPGPRLGFFGVVDERMDLELLAQIARLRPQWTLVVIGPVVKIDSATLPDLPNIHYLGSKKYEELPAYAAGWDIALMPFALNDATRFISPTKTPEYLAAGLPVVSTPIVDVVRHYGHLEAVGIASGTEAFVEACEAALALKAGEANTWRAAVNIALADLSWDNVSSQMSSLIDGVIEKWQSANKPQADKPYYDYLVVGAGFAGSVMAERLASDLGKHVLIIDRRSHVGGNAYDHIDESGVLIHRYGPHIFHTNSDEIVDYLSNFTGWRPYAHRVLARIDDSLVPIPINRTTLNTLYGLSLTTDDEVADFLASRAEPVETVRTSADVVISKIGTELYEKFFRGYTRKQWGMDPSELDKAVTGRIPTRTNEDDRYFTDRFQAMPDEGYTAMFERMLDHPNIDIAVNAEFNDIKERVRFGKLVFTGPVDEYFGHCYGKLPYRSLEFRHETLDQEWFQSVAVVNFPDEAVTHTRITEYKHLTGQISDKTSISYEFPRSAGDPYYPIPRPENQELYKRYEALALVSPDVIFVGRLATYRYYNMDQVVGQAMATYRRHKTDLATAGSEGGRTDELLAAE